MSLVKLYQVISLLKCLGKVVEKVIASLLSEFCEVFSKLYFGQIGAQKRQCTIDIVASLVHNFQKCWTEKKLIATLFMDVKGTFDHVSRRKLVEKMTKLGIEGDIVQWTQSFFTDRRV